MKKKPQSVVGNVPKVYSYIRFSTPEQALGDSERRQLEGAKAFAARKNLPLDESLKLIDKGRSGYHGTNRTQGKFGEFLSLVKDGKIASGSILVVENIDRLSREPPLAALSTCTELIHAGITIATLEPPNEYNSETIKMGLIYQLVGQIDGAHQASSLKSSRIRESRKTARLKARVDGKTLTKRFPLWIVEKDGKRIALPEAAKTINSIFTWRLKGLSTRAICRKLNENLNYWQPPPISTKPKNNEGKPRTGANGWYTGYIRKILTNRAVIGEYQPFARVDGSHKSRKPEGEPIKGYFPAIVPVEKFNAVQTLLAVNKEEEKEKGKGGRTGKWSNVLRYLVRCAYCYGSMAYEDKGSSNTKGGPYLACDMGRRHVSKDGKPVCGKHRVRYDECLDLLLRNLPKLDPRLVLPNESQNATAIENCRRRLLSVQEDIVQTSRKVENLEKALESDMSSEQRSKLIVRCDGLLEEQKELERHKRQIELDLAKHQSKPQQLVEWQEGILKLKAGLAGDDSETRELLNSHLRQLVSKIEVFAKGHRRHYDSEAVFEATSKAKKELLEKDRMANRKLNDEKSFGDVFDLIHHPYVVEARDGDSLYDELMDNATPQQMEDSQFLAFVDYVMQRRFSRDGRFIRVHFTTGFRIDLVPPGSIATGFRLDDKRDEWKVEKPNLETLVEEFRKARTSKRKPKR